VWSINVSHPGVDPDHELVAEDVHVNPHTCNIGKLSIMREDMSLKLLNRPRWSAYLAERILEEYRENPMHEARRHAILADCIGKK
jgi:hypothetical protein